MDTRANSTGQIFSVLIQWSDSLLGLTPGIGRTSNVKQYSQCYNSTATRTLLGSREDSVYLPAIHPPEDARESDELSVTEAPSKQGVSLPLRPSHSLYLR